MSKPKFFDIHTHLNFSDFDEDRGEAIKRCLDNDIWMINVGSDLASSKKAIEIAQGYKEGIYATVGLHPTDATEETPPSELKELAKNKKVVAIGECGLDYFHIKDESEREKQKKVFREQIELALELNKPLVIHCREAHDDLAKILNEYSDRNLKGHLHFFGGEGAWEKKDEYLKMGLSLSFTGVVTFPKYSHIEDLKNIPLDKIMIETDAPFVAPVPYRGQRNEPAYVVEVAKKLAEIKSISVEEVAETTTQNALKLFGIN
jgi:TatD DNase family protein